MHFMSYDLGASPRIKIGRLEVRPDETAALVDGTPIGLTHRELEVLALLASRPDRIMPREAIYEAIWGKTASYGERSVDVYVSRIRNKLAVVIPEAEAIHTHPGIGYRFSYEG
jgi:two-component system alkaline phosphatase synthesis response regulator PhoP